MDENGNGLPDWYVDISPQWLMCRVRKLPIQELDGVHSGGNIYKGDFFDANREGRALFYAIVILLRD